jgi:2-oxoisovalerate dehydrogenase E1 component alpha subunit
MPDHYTAKAHGIGSVSSPIGTQIVHAVGFAWAAKLRGDDRVALAYFGEGATSSHDFHNAMNFAGVFRAPVVLVCRNNGWAISVPSDRQTASGTFAQKGLAYGVRYARCDGNDLFAVVRCAREAVERAAAGGGPTLLEALTYRMSGHSTSDDPGVYRAEQALEPWRARDPLERVRRHLERAGLWSEADADAAERQIEAEIKAAVAQAETAPAPPLETMFDDVYARLPWHLEEQRRELLGGPRAPAHH